MKPVIEKLAKDDNAKTWFLGELDYDENTALAKTLQVHVLPTLFALKGTDFTVVQPGSVERPQDSLVKDEIETPGDNRFIPWDENYEQKMKDWIKAKIDKSGSTLG
jgi:thioredoxin-like negative regulator of GroEL